MPKFNVPITITLNAKDADQAYNRVAFSSINDLEISGLIRISVGTPTCAASKTRCRIPDSSQIQDFLTKAVAELSAWDSRNEISTDNPIALADLVREAREMLSQLKP